MTDWEKDAELLERWRAGDDHAGEQLFDRHGRAVSRFFRNKVHKDIDDLVQATFLALIEGRERIRRGAAFRAFILGIARNILTKHLRKLQRGREVDPEVDSMAELAPGASTISSRKQEHKLLLEGLRRLPVTHQLALELFYWEELNAAEIAEIMGVSHSAMRSRLAKARSLLEQSMAEVAASPELLASTIGGLERWAGEVRERFSR